MKARVPTFIAVVSAAVVFGIPRLALAQTPPHDHTQPSTVSQPSAPAPPVSSEPKPGMKMPEMKMDGMKMGDMKMDDMKMGEKKVEAMKAAKERIDGLMARLKATEGPARVDVLAELVTALVERHESMCQEMMMSGHAGK